MKLGLPIQWRIGGLLLAIGGAVSAIGAAIFTFGPQEAGSALTIAAAFLEGAGIVTLSFAFGSERVPVWSLRSLLAAGIAVLLEFVIVLVSILSIPLPGVISAVLYVVLAATLLISAIAFFRGVPAGRAIRWALLPAAIFQAADVLLASTGYGGEWWTLVILGVLYVLAGVICVGYRRQRLLGSRLSVVPE